MSVMSERPRAWKPTDTLGTRLTLVRRELNLSQAEAARRCNLTPRVWQNMEDGRATRHEVENVKRISLALGVDREWLMWGGPLNEEGPSGGGPEGQATPVAGDGRKKTKRGSLDYLSVGPRPKNVFQLHPVIPARPAATPLRNAS